MGWIDDRIWCHPKLANVSNHAFRVYINGLAYSSGFNCRGHLTEGQQRTIGGDTKARNELIKAGLWDKNGDGSSIDIHDWATHNSKRDERRERDRVRKRDIRKKPLSDLDVPAGADDDIPF